MTATLHVIFGPQGAGKSTYAKDLARRLPAVGFAIDDWMGRLFGPDMPEPLEFQWMMDRVERCEAQIWSTAAGVLAAGASVVLDLGLMRRSDRQRVAEIAEASDHHPDIDIRWRTLTFRCSTHSAGGVTDLDTALAAAISSQVAEAGG